MHPEILNPGQKKLLPLLKKFSRTFGLVGGTAIAYHLGHRESIDFDMFSYKEFNNSRIKTKIEEIVSIETTFVKRAGEYTIMIDGVKMTFFQYPYQISYPVPFCGVSKIPDLLTLATMKIFALGRRAKWKDYVDLYFILRDHYTLAEINTKAVEIFGTEYNEKIVRSQLSFFDDISYAEPVIYRPGYEVPDQVVKDALVEFSLAK